MTEQIETGQTPKPQPTMYPRTAQLMMDMINGKFVARHVGDDLVAARELIFWNSVDARRAFLRLLKHAADIETELTTWRTLPPREHYNLADCHKALRWHLKQLNIEHEHIGQILARMEQLRAGEAAASDGVTGD